MVTGSTEELVGFLNTCEKKGWLNATTARAMRMTCERLFGLLEPERTAEVSAVNVGDLVRRFHNKEPGASASTLRTYEWRVRKAISEFARYKEDPAHWKPGIESRVRKKQEASPKEAAPPTQDSSVPKTNGEVFIAAGSDISSKRQRYSVSLGADGRTAMIDVPLPLRPQDLKLVKRWAEYMEGVIADEKTPDTSST